MPEKHGSFKVENLGLGLNVRDRPTTLPIGSAQICENVWLHRSVLSNQFSLKRVSLHRIDAATPLLDGLTQVFRSDVTVTGGATSLKTGTRLATLEFVFRSDSLRATQLLLYKGRGATTIAADEFDWFVSYGTDATGNPIVSFRYRKGVGSYSAILSTGTLTFATPYYIRITLDHTVAANTQTTANIYWRAIGAGAESGPNTNTEGTYVESGTIGDVYAGGDPSAAPIREADLFENPTQGIVQEIRFWNSIRSPGASAPTYNRQLTSAEQAADTDLIAYYQLTGSGPVSFVDLKGNANPLKLEPVFLNYGAALVGSGSSLDLDGNNDGFIIPGSYRYLNPIKDSSNQYHSWRQFGITFSVNCDALRNFQTVLHWVPTIAGTLTVNQTILLDFDTGGAVQTYGYSGAIGAPAVLDHTAIVTIDTVNVSADTTGTPPPFGANSNFQFRAIVPFDDGTYAVVLTGIPNGIAIGTTYTLMLTIDNTNGEIKFWVYGQPAPTHAYDKIITVINTKDTFKTADDPIGSSVKYMMLCGRNIKRSQKGSNNEADPDDVYFETDFSRCFDGRLDGLAIINFETSGLAGVPFLLNYLGTNALTRATVNSLREQVLSCYNFDEGAQESVADIGQVKNDLFIKTDPGHVFAKSLITTNTKSKLHHLVEHRYSKGGQEIKKVLIVHDGGIAEFVEGATPPSTSTLTHIADGVRNDAGDLAQYIRFRGTTIIACGGKPLHVVEDQVYPLSIEPSTAFVPSGLTKQNSKSANIVHGRYIAGFRFYSAITGKYSPVFGLTTLNVLTKRASFLWGLNAEINQTAATCPFGALASGALIATPSYVKEPYDLTNIFNAVATSTVNYFLRFVGFDTSTETGPTATPPNPGFTRGKMLVNGSTVKVPIANKRIEEPTSLKANEVDAVMRGVPLSEQRAYVSQRGDGSFDILSAFVGSNARLRVTDNTGADAGQDSMLNLFWNIGTTHHNLPNDTATDFFTGTGIPGGTGFSSHGITLPISDDRQVTHLQYLRTNTDGTDLRVLLSLPNGTKTFEDNIDDEFNTGEIVDLTEVSVPKTKYVNILNGRLIFAGDPEQPQRLSIAPAGKPWVVSSSAFVDFLDGRTRSISGLGGTEEQILLLKDDVTFVLSPTMNPVFPFHVDVRLRDTGGTSPHAIIPVRTNLFYPEEQGPQTFTGTYPSYIGRVIEDLWQSLSVANRPIIVGVHQVESEVVLFGVPSGATFDLTGHVVNDQMLGYFYREAGGYGWTKITNIPVRQMAIVADPNEVDQVYFLDHAGFIYKWNAGDSFEGGTLGAGLQSAPLTTLSVTVSAGGASTVTVPRANVTNFPEGYVGLFVTLVKPDATRQTRMVTIDDGGSPATITVDHAWSVAPVSGDTLLIASVESRWRSGDLLPLGPEGFGKVANVTVRQKIMGTAAKYTFGLQGRGGMGGVSGANVYAPAFQTGTISNNLEEDAYLGMVQRGKRFVADIDARGLIPFEIHGVILDVEGEGSAAFKKVST